MIPESALAAACRQLGSRIERGAWFRAVQPRYVEQALNPVYAKRVAGRFHHAGANQALYLVASPEIAPYEVELVLGRPGDPGASIPNPNAGAYVLLTVEASLSALVDLTKADALATLQTTAQELTGDWRGYGQRSSRTRLHEPTGDAPTQILGAALYASELFEGFTSFSAKAPYEPILCVFPDRLQPKSSLEYRWEDATGAQRSHSVRRPGP